MKQFDVFPAWARVVFASLILSLAAFTTGAGESNICGAAELWEGNCLSTDDWTAGWYLHPDNDPGDGAAVETAYANFAHVIVDKPHSMCIDWRTANCDGAIPPAPPARGGRSTRLQLADGAVRIEACVAQAKTEPSIDAYCRQLYAYELPLSNGDLGFDARRRADKLAFVARIWTREFCGSAGHFIRRNSAEYTAGTLSDDRVSRMEVYIIYVRSWACVTAHNMTPPAIPDPPSS